MFLCFLSNDIRDCLHHRDPTTMAHQPPHLDDLDSMAMGEGPYKIPQKKVRPSHTAGHLHNHKK